MTNDKWMEGNTISGRCEWTGGGYQAAMTRVKSEEVNQ